MSDRMRDKAVLGWRVFYPLLLYGIVNVAVAVLLLFAADKVLLLTAVSAAVTYPVLYVLFRKDQQSRGIACTVGLHLPKASGVIALLGAVSCISINSLLSLPYIDVIFVGFEEASKALYEPPLLVQIAATGFIIPLTEEMIFRGLGYRRLRDETGFWAAALLSSLFFGFYHGNMPQGIYAFLMGLMMCRLYENHGGLPASLLFHVSANLTSLLFRNHASLEYLMDSAYAQVAAVLMGLTLMLYIRSNMLRNAQKQ